MCSLTAAESEKTRALPRIEVFSLMTPVHTSYMKRKWGNIIIKSNKSSHSTLAPKRGGEPG